MAIEQLNEQLAIVSVIDPDAYSAGTLGGDVIDMALHHRVLFVLAVGEMQSGSKVDMKIQESTDGSTGWTDLTGKAITQLTEAGTDDDKQAEIEVCDDEMTELYRYLRSYVTVTSAASDLFMVALADNTRYKPSSVYDLSSVDEIIQ